MPDEQRLQALEELVRTLSREVARLSREVESLRGGDAAPPHGMPPGKRGATPRVGQVAERPAPRKTAAATAWRGLELETLVGRYGALALAALAILLGVGVFLSWAVEHVQLGPRMRVLLGMVAAAGVASVGIVLRRRGARRFGNVLLGLALAIVHVVAWGAGPYLDVVSPTIAFAGAAAASIALAALAWREDEETLFSVGVGGALLAPFVTSEGGEQIFQLLGFGALVLGTGMLAIGERPWRFAARILIAGATLYVGAALDAMAIGLAAERAAPATFALLCTWVALALTSPPIRLSIGRATTALGIAALLYVTLSRREALLLEVIVMAVLATLTTYALAHRSAGMEARRVVPVSVILPLGALAAALLAIPDMATVPGAVIAAAWTAMAAGAARLQGGRLRDAHLLVLALAGGTAVVLALEHNPEACVLALGVWAFVLAMADRRLLSSGLGTGIVLVLAVASVWALDLLLQRRAYGYTPFLTMPSAASVVVLAAWWALATRPGQSDRGHVVIRLSTGALTVGWGYVELARAFSPDMATFLVILYFASAGIAAILLGRARGLPAARHAGLALAIFAGVKALLQAATLVFGLRLASYLVVGAFLLGVAYVYRATSESSIERA